MKWSIRTLALGLASLPAILASWPASASAQIAPSEILDSLRRGDVYVAETARPRVSERDDADLKTYADRQRSRGHQVKLVVLDRPPAGFQTLGQFVEAAHGALELGEGILIAVAMDAGAGSGSVSAKTGALDDGTVRRFQQSNVGSFTAGTYADGLKALADDLTREIERQRAAERTRNQAILVSLIAIGFGAAIAILVRRANAWKQDLADANEVRGSLYPLLRRLDDDLPYLAGSEEAQRASEAHAQGSERYHRATEILEELAGISWAAAALPGQHQALVRDAGAQLEAARLHLTEANAMLDRAAGARPTGGPR